MVPRLIIGKNHPLLKLITLAALLLTVDQATKALSSQTIFNYGFFLGSIEWASAFYRTFCTVALLGIVVLGISLIQYLTRLTYPALMMPTLLIEIGVLGNGLDRIRFGGVRDFIHLSIFSPPLILNLADFYQWMGILALLFLVWRHPDRLWSSGNLRNRLLVFPQSQLRIAKVLVWVTSLIALGNFLLLLAYLDSNLIPVNFRELIICFGLFLILTEAIIFIFALVWSNRIYGPFRAIERQLLQNKDTHPAQEIKVRLGDENEVVRAILTLLGSK